MIRINLLPEEFRPKEAPTLPYAMVVLGGGGLCILLICGLIVFYLTRLRGLENDRVATEKELAGVKRELSDAESRENRFKTDLDRKRVALALKYARPLWSPVLDAFWTEIDGMGDLWVERITLEEVKKKSRSKKDEEKEPDAVLSLQVASSAASGDLYEQLNERRVAELMERMTRNEMIAGKRDRYALGVAIWKGVDDYRKSYGIPALSAVVGIGQWRGEVSEAKKAAKGTKD